MLWGMCHMLVERQIVVPLSWSVCVFQKKKTQKQKQREWVVTGMMLLCVSSIVNCGVSDTTTSYLETVEDVVCLASNISSRTILLFGLNLLT
jgi:FlaA1/EpsC-like NDP-sugar epimerase